MSKILCIKSKILSLRGKMFVTDEQENTLYEANGELAFIAPSWRIHNSQGEVAALKRKIFAWSSTWMISSSFGGFIIKRKLWSWSRCYTIIGGSFDGAEVNGNLWDLKFQIEYFGRQVAKANASLFSLRDKHVVEVISDDAKEELLTVITMVALLLDKRSGDSSASSGSD